MTIITLPDSDVEVLNTVDLKGVDIVSIGAQSTYRFRDMNITFPGRFVPHQRIDEKNLTDCLYLCLNRSLLTHLNTRFLVKLLYLDISFTKIVELNTSYLTNLLILNLHKAAITHLQPNHMPALLKLDLDFTAIDLLETCYFTYLEVLSAVGMNGLCISGTGLINLV